MEPSTSSDTTSKPRCCILHVDVKQTKKQRQSVLSFGTTQWAAVQRAAQKRRSKRNFEDSVYFNIVQNLPDEFPSDSAGYHVQCYKNFTAVASSAPDNKCESNVPAVPCRRSSAEPGQQPSTCSTIILPPVCLFCGKTRKRLKNNEVEYLGSCETFEACDKIQDAARRLNDQNMLSKTFGTDLIAKEAKYHHSCKSAYLMSANRAASKEQAGGDEKDSSSSRKCVALDNIYAYIERSVITGNRPELMTSIYERYLDFCMSTEETPLQSTNSLVRNLMSKFKCRVKIQTPFGKKSGNIIYNAETADNAVRLAYDYASTEERTVTKAALILRKQLLAVEKSEIVDNPGLDDLRKGDASAPTLVDDFFKLLYGGITGPKPKEVERRAQSSSQDALFIVQRGRVKPEKHVTLGMTVKSTTGSRKLVTVLNRFGHCLNYTSLEELETSTADSLQEEGVACPHGTLKGVPMGLAFNNFDELTNTLSGADSLHDTMGILYQNIPESTLDFPQVGGPPPRKSSGGTSQKSIRKRTLDLQELPLAPYHGTPKVKIFDYRNTDVFNFPAEDAAKARHRDLVWMMSHAVGASILPMWIGFNAKLTTDNLPRQEIRYMPNLRQPITSLDVIHQTLITTQMCAKECNQEYGVVTYDLNAAKPAMQIQSSEKPKFDNVFIMPGTFHVEMAFFKALGKLVEESGGANMLTETDVLAPGSLNGFITGKHFNRCKRLHPILALAFEILHFLVFLERYERKAEIEAILSNVQSNTTESDIEAILSSGVFVAGLVAYEDYTQKTRSGEHGATAQFWRMYIDYIQQFHLVERAIRTNDIDLYIRSLTDIIGLFFATNHVNYSRWLTKFQLDLLNVDNSHPGLRDILDQGIFTVRRTDKPFSRSPVDLTLEQTINADAASRLTGVTSVTDNYAARLRWMLTKSTRASLASHLQEMAGMVTKEDTSAELKPSRMKRDCSDLGKVISQIKDSFNPFTCEKAPSDTLFNISTGKGTSDEVRDCLLKIPATGKKRHKEFVEACVNDPNRFEQRITKVALKTFADSCGRNRRTTDKRIAALKCTRDLMGRLVILATKRKLNLEHIFSYPLTPLPQSLCNRDEMMAKTNKSQLLNLLEKRVNESTKPERIDAYIIDAQFLLHVLPPNLPASYGGLARSILLQAVALSKKQVHIVFDDYPQPSLKDAERARRGAIGADAQTYAITGPLQRRPKDMGEALKSRSFKKELPVFLSNEWVDQSYESILGNCELFLDIPGVCYHFHVVNGVIHRDEVDGLKSNHEEADTKIIIHGNAADTEGGNIVVRASDTDIAVILIHHANLFSAILWMDVGTAAKNNRRFIDISAISVSLGKELCAALPGFHAFTGSDYTSAFVRKGKVRPFARLEKSSDAQKAFAEMAKTDTLPDKQRDVLFEYVAMIYGAKESAKLNCHRYKTFEKAFRPKATSQNPLAKLKGLDGSLIPPCEAEVMTHIQRASFVAKMWSQANRQEIVQHPKKSDGWEFEDGSYVPVWFDGPQLPDSLVPHEDEMNDNGDEDEEKMEAASSDEEEEQSDDEK